jgi:subtilisin family serine protease
VSTQKDCANHLCSTRADTWFENLGDSAHRILDKYNGYLFEGNNNEMKSYEQVKIAILDTGVAQSSKANTPETIRRSKARLKWRQPKGNDMPPREDEDGHGTQVASIILQVTPFAQVFIYRIVRHREDPINPSIVADAIEDAVQAGVDIINLSFGWDHEHDEVRTALKRCIEQDVLVFAATSNNDLESVSGMAYPASDDRVIAIDAASSRGEWLPSNPGRDNEIKTQRFTALGEGIKTDFPPELGSADGSTRMSGTSAATPIAVGIAALVLEFARQPPLGYAKKAAMFLKRPEAMRAVLAGTVAKRFSRHGEYHHLVPAELFTCDKNTVDTGDWYSSKGPHGRAVNKITDVLGRKYGHEFAVPMHDRIEEEFMRLAYAKRTSH